VLETEWRLWGILNKKWGVDPRRGAGLFLRLRVSVGRIIEATPKSEFETRREGSAFFYAGIVPPDSMKGKGGLHPSGSRNGGDWG